jgi:hypothetical protein
MKSQAIALAAALALNLNAAIAADTHTDHHVPDHDDRVVLDLNPGERAMILTEMRMFLDGLQKMTGALGKQELQAAAKAARNMGQKMVHEVPPELRKKLPQEFRRLGFSVHNDFDQIALDAESLKDVSTTLNQLSATLQKCVQCHSIYQIRTPAHDAGH